MQEENRVHTVTTEDWSNQLSELRSDFVKYYYLAMDFRSPRHLHQARVALRRLLTMLGAIQRGASHAKGRGTLRNVIKYLKQKQSQLGQVRDLDVFVAHHQSDPLYQLGDHQMDIILHLQIDYERAQSRLACVTGNHTKRNKEFDKLWARFAGNIKRYTRQLDVNSLFNSMRNEHTRATKRFEKARRKHGASDPETLRRLHDMRLATKQVRYASRSLAFALAEQSPDAIKELEARQDRLGEITDLSNFLKLLKRHQKAFQPNHKKRLKAQRKKINEHLHKLVESL